MTETTSVSHVPCSSGGAVGDQSSHTTPDRGEERRAGSVGRESTSERKLGKPGNDGGAQRERAVTREQMRLCAAGSRGLSQGRSALLPPNTGSQGDSRREAAVASASSSDGGNGKIVQMPNLTEGWGTSGGPVESTRCPPYGQWS